MGSCVMVSLFDFHHSITLSVRISAEPYQFNLMLIIAFVRLVCACFCPFWVEKLDKKTRMCYVRDINNQILITELDLFSLIEILRNNRLL